MPVSGPPPWACTANDLIPVVGIVAARQNNNDNAAIGLDPALFSGASPPQRLDLPCGSYYLSNLSTNNDVTIVAPAGLTQDVKRLAMPLVDSVMASQPQGAELSVADAIAENGLRSVYQPLMKVLFIQFLALLTANRDSCSTGLRKFGTKVHPQVKHLFGTLRPRESLMRPPQERRVPHGLHNPRPDAFKIWYVEQDTNAFCRVLALAIYRDEEQFRGLRRTLVMGLLERIEGTDIAQRPLALMILFTFSTFLQAPSRETWSNTQECLQDFEKQKKGTQQAQLRNAVALDTTLSEDNITLLIELLDLRVIVHRRGQREFALGRRNSNGPLINLGVDNGQWYLLRWVDEPVWVIQARGLTLSSGASEFTMPLYQLPRIEELALEDSEEEDSRGSEEEEEEEDEEYDDGAFDW